MQLGSASSTSGKTHAALNHLAVDFRKAVIDVVLQLRRSITVTAAQSYTRKEKNYRQTARARLPAASVARIWASPLPTWKCRIRSGPTVPIKRTPGLPVSWI